MSFVVLGSSSTHLINNREQAKIKYVSSAIKYGLANGILSRTGNSFSFSDNIVDSNPYGPKQYKISKRRKQKVPSLRTCKICTQRLNLRPSLNRNSVLKEINTAIENDSEIFGNPSSEEFLKSFSTVLRRSDSSIQSNLCDKSCGRTPEKKMHWISVSSEATT